jgi:hypothetical protein
MTVRTQGRALTQPRRTRRRLADPRAARAQFQGRLLLFAGGASGAFEAVIYTASRGQFPPIGWMGVPASLCVGAIIAYVMAGRTETRTRAAEQIAIARARAAQPRRTTTQVNPELQALRERIARLDPNSIDPDLLPAPAVPAEATPGPVRAVVPIIETEEVI